VKTSRDQLLIFAQDMKTGKGRAGARILVTDGNQVILDAKTGKFSSRNTVD
jgi:ribose 5-phosphate isomerase